MGTAMKVPKHTRLAAPSVQTQLLTGLQLWSGKAGPMPFKAQGFTGQPT